MPYAHIIFLSDHILPIDQTFKRPLFNAPKNITIRATCTIKHTYKIFFYPLLINFIFQQNSEKQNIWCTLKN